MACTLCWVSMPKLMLLPAPDTDAARRADMIVPDTATPIAPPSDRTKVIAPVAAPIDPALIIFIMRRSGTADAERWRGSAAVVWIGCAYAGRQLASAVPCCAPAPCAGAPASSPRSRLHPD